MSPSGRILPTGNRTPPKKRLSTQQRWPMPMSYYPLPPTNPGRGTSRFGGQSNGLPSLGRSCEPADPDPGRSHLGFGYRKERLAGGLERLMKGRTTFIIAHRLSTVQGRTNCRPSHGKLWRLVPWELLQAHGLYAKMHGEVIFHSVEEGEGKG